jgi:nicotinamidase/pyrazinamidase
MRALIVVDIQNDFLPGGALAVPKGDSIISVVNQLQELFPVVVATQDWHPAHHGSFAANHPGKRPFDQIQLSGMPQTLWPVHCVQDTPGAALAANLNKERIDSYSGFFDNGHRKATGMAEWLQSAGVTEVSICGLATDYCVKFTALDAVSLGFRTHLIEDATRGVNLKPDDVANAVKGMKGAGVIVLQSAQIPETQSR